MSELLNFTPSEVRTGIILPLIVALILAVFKIIPWLFSFFGKRKSHDYHYDTSSQIYDDNPYQRPRTSGQAMWAVGLAFFSYLFWVTFPPLAVVGICVSLWLGFNTRNQTAGKVAIFTSCAHLMMVICGILLLIVYAMVAMQSSYYRY